MPEFAPGQSPESEDQKVEDSIENEGQTVEPKPEPEPPTGQLRDIERELPASDPAALERHQENRQRRDLEDATLNQLLKEVDLEQTPETLTELKEVIETRVRILKNEYAELQANQEAVLPPERGIVGGLIGRVADKILPPREINETTESNFAVHIGNRLGQIDRLESALKTVKRRLQTLKKVSKLDQI